LGVLSCTGTSDEDGKIKGRVVQLDTLVSVNLEVEIDYESDENTARWGRRLTLRCDDGYEIVLDASPDTDTDDVREKIETFIDEALGALADR